MGLTRREKVVEDFDNENAYNIKLRQKKVEKNLDSKIQNTLKYQYATNFGTLNKVETTAEKYKRIQNEIITYIKNNYGNLYCIRENYLLGKEPIDIILEPIKVVYNRVDILLDIKVNHYPTFDYISKKRQCLYLYQNSKTSTTIMIIIVVEEDENHGKNINSIPVAYPASMDLLIQTVKEKDILANKSGCINLLR